MSTDEFDEIWGYFMKNAPNVGKRTKDGMRLMAERAKLIYWADINLPNRSGRDRYLNPVYGPGIQKETQ